MIRKYVVLGIVSEANAWHCACVCAARCARIECVYMALYIRRVCLATNDIYGSAYRAGNSMFVDPTLRFVAFNTKNLEKPLRLDRPAHSTLTHTVLCHGNARSESNNLGSARIPA